MIDCASFKFSGHAIRRMFERQVMPYHVTEAVNNGEIIADYPHDTPYPSVLILGWVTQRPLHVVLAKDPSGVCQVITAYWPDSLIWSTDFKTRRK
jgi:hypothetical protein